MIINPKFTIFFGEATSSAFTITELKEALINNQLQQIKLKLKNKLEKYDVQNFYFNHQVHGTEGSIITSEAIDKSFENDGDFIITDQKNLAIGVLTADCLPIIYYDHANHIAAIAHAGWRGTVDNIALITVENMKKHFNSKVENIDVLLGPSAKHCCYEVSKDFIENITDRELIEKTFFYKQDKIFFDVPLYNKINLQKLGIKNIDTSHNICTMCNPNYCSHRRDSSNSGRQISMILLH